VLKKKSEVCQCGKPDCPISQTGVSSFGRIETSLVEDDNIDDEYDYEELLLEFKKLISKYMKL
jgi:hypothetical protein